MTVHVVDIPITIVMIITPLRSTACPFLREVFLSIRFRGMWAEDAFTVLGVMSHGSLLERRSRERA
jgi:hypothetical protein